MTAGRPDSGAPSGPEPLPGNEDLAALLRAMAGRRVLVLADLIVDEFVLTGEPRVSREAPVLILKYREKRHVAGGGANAAANVAALGGIPLIAGEVGADEAGTRLLEGLESMGADVGAVMVRPGARTPCKTRFLAGDKHVALQQVVRVDRIEPFEHDAGFWEDARARIGPLVERADAVIASDYGLGFVEPALVRAVTAGKGRPPIAVDSRYRLFEHDGADVATPSEPELEAAMGRSLADDAAIESAGQQALARLRSQALLVTRGSRGMVLFERGAAPTAIPAFGSGTVADVTGAGDTVIATLGLALAAGGGWVAASRLANAAAGVAVTKMGTATVSADELLAALSRDPA